MDGQLDKTKKNNIQTNKQTKKNMHRQVPKCPGRRENG